MCLTRITKEVFSPFEDVKKQLNKRENVTVYGELQAFLLLSKGRSLEITKELYPFNNEGYSLRIHCSEEEFDNGIYENTNGIVETFLCADNDEALFNTLNSVMEYNNTLKKEMVKE